MWHVGSRVNWRTWHLVTEAAFGVFVECLGRAIERFGVDLLAFVLMSNHYHAVLRSPPGSEYRRHTSRRTRCRHTRRYPAGHAKSTVIGQCVHHFKLGVAKRIQRSLGLDGHFWEGRHFRRKIVDALDLVVAIAYDHRNPVREAMATRPEDYPRSSAAWWFNGEAAPLPLCRRADLPFGLSHQDLRGELLRFQGSGQLDGVVEALGESPFGLDEPEGCAELERLLTAVGLAPLVRPSAAREEGAAPKPHRDALTPVVPADCVDGGRSDYGFEPRVTR